MRIFCSWTTKKATTCCKYALAYPTWTWSGGSWRGTRIWIVSPSALFLSTLRATKGKRRLFVHLDRVQGLIMSFSSRDWWWTLFPPLSFAQRFQTLDWTIASSSWWSTVQELTSRRGCAGPVRTCQTASREVGQEDTTTDRHFYVKPILIVNIKVVWRHEMTMLAITSVHWFIFRFACPDFKSSLISSVGYDKSINRWIWTRRKCSQRVMEI
jgi:hypothetical protein